MTVPEADDEANDEPPVFFFFPPKVRSTLHSCLAARSSPPYDPVAWICVSTDYFIY